MMRLRNENLNQKSEMGSEQGLSKIHSDVTPFFGLSLCSKPRDPCDEGQSGPAGRRRR